MQRGWRSHLWGAEWGWDVWQRAGAGWVQGSPAGWVHPGRCVWVLGVTAPGGERRGKPQEARHESTPLLRNLAGSPCTPLRSPRGPGGTPSPRWEGWTGSGRSSVCLARGLSAPRWLQGPWGQDGGGEGNIFALSPLVARVNGKAAVGPWPRGDGSTCGTCRGDIKAVTVSLPPPAAVSADLTNFLRLGGRMGGVGVTLPGPRGATRGGPGTKPQLWETGLREDRTPLMHPQPHGVPQCSGEQQWYWGSWGSPSSQCGRGAVGSGGPSPAPSLAHGGPGRREGGTGSCCG